MNVDGMSGCIDYIKKAKIDTRSFPETFWAFISTVVFLVIMFYSFTTTFSYREDFSVSL